MGIYVFSIVLIVVSNIVYNVCQKSTPPNANPFSALLITYLTAALLTLIASLFYRSEKGYFHSFSELNWTSVALGGAIVGLELGYLLAFRAGWNISLGSLVANSILALLLIPIGILFYNEGFAFTQIVGVAFCMVGLILINT